MIKIGRHIISLLASAQPCLRAHASLSVESGRIRSEAVRDLFRSDTQPEQSYSERQLYEAALDRLSREIAAVQRVTETEAVKEIEAALANGPRRGPKPAEEEAVVEDEAA